MRVKVEFEAEANYTNGHWVVWYRDVYNNIDTTLLPDAWVTPLECPEPPEHGYYKITYANGVKSIVYRGIRGWYSAGDYARNTWQELGNIVAVERIEL